MAQCTRCGKWIDAQKDALCEKCAFFPGLEPFSPESQGRKIECEVWVKPSDHQLLENLQKGILSACHPCFCGSKRRNECESFQYCLEAHYSKYGQSNEKKVFANCRKLKIQESIEQKGDPK